MAHVIINWTEKKIVSKKLLYIPYSVKGTHKENDPSNKTETHMISMNIYVWVIGTLNHLFIGGSYSN